MFPNPVMPSEIFPEKVRTYYNNDGSIKKEKLVCTVNLMYFSWKYNQNLNNILKSMREKIHIGVFKITKIMLWLTYNN